MRSELIGELAFSERLIRQGHEVVPRYRVYSTEGSFRVFIQMPDDINERHRLMGLVRLFMVSKMATHFTMATEVQVPDASCAVAVGRKGSEGLLQVITRNPISFSKPISLTPAQISDDVIGLLPKRSEGMSKGEIAQLAAALHGGHIHIFDD